MKKILFLILLLSQIVFAQNAPNKYEVEMLKNPNKGGKDTREVNAVIIFQKDSIQIVSRRKKQIFKELKYSEIQYVEHSFSKKYFTLSNSVLAVFTVLMGVPIIISEDEKHWLTIVSNNDFAVLKIENDNYRLLKNEFLIRDFDLVNIDENK